MLLGPTEKRHYKWVEFDVGSFLVQWGFSARTPISPSKTNISKFPYHHRLQNSPYFLRIQVGASSQTKGLKGGWKRRARLGRDRERLALFARVRFLSYAKTILRKKKPDCFAVYYDQDLQTNNHYMDALPSPASTSKTFVQCRRKFKNIWLSYVCRHLANCHLQLLVFEAKGKLPCSLETRERRENTVKNQPRGREASTNTTWSSASRWTRVTLEGDEKSSTSTYKYSILNYTIPYKISWENLTFLFVTSFY